MSRAAAGVGTEINTAAKQASSSGMRMKPSRKGDQFIDFFVDGVVIFLFSFSVGLLNCVNCNPFPR